MGTVHSEECSPAVGRARLPSIRWQLERVYAIDRMRWLQGLELLVTVLLARNRQPPGPATAQGDKQRRK